MSEIEQGAATPPTGTTQILYALHLVAPFTAWLLAVVAIVIGMATRDGVRGTWVDSHYSWLSRTFWFGLLWIVVLAALTVVMMLTVIPRGCSGPSSSSGTCTA